MAKKCQRIAITNFKGGVAKTCTTVGLGAALGRMGYKVLLVDMDPQGHVGMHLGLKEPKGYIEDVLDSKGRSLEDIIVPTNEDNVFLAPSSERLGDARMNLYMRKGSDAVLSRAVDAVENYFDFVIFDSPPDLSVLSVNVMYAANAILIPSMLKADALDGIRRVLMNLDELREAHPHRKWGVLGILITHHDARSKVENRINLSSLEEAFGDQKLLFEQFIPTDEEFPRAWRRGESLFSHNARTKGARALTRVAQEIIERTGAPSLDDLVVARPKRKRSVAQAAAN